MTLTPLPPSHFLALPPTFANDPSVSHTTASHASASAPNTASTAAADFDVDVRTGFLPPGGTVERLPDPYDVWEDAFEAARGEGPGDGLKLGSAGVREKAWRHATEGMPVLDITELRAQGLPALRRAHMVLAFLTHFYVHCQPIGVDAPAIPACISVPFLAVSPLVGLPPILTYADTVLWNCLPKDPKLPTNMDNNPPTRCIGSFTNTKSEDGFYLVSAECEAAGAAALGLMRKSLDELFLGDDLAMRRLTGYLTQLAVLIDRVGDVTLRMNTECDPEEFYFLIRPWFRGGDAQGPDAPGWIFLGADPEAEAALDAAENRLLEPAGAGRKFSGPSAGQSSLIHAFDIFLTVDHNRRDDEEDAVLTSAPIGARPSAAPASPVIRLNAAPIGDSDSCDSSDVSDDEGGLPAAITTAPIPTGEHLSKACDVSAVSARRGSPAPAAVLSPVAASAAPLPRGARMPKAGSPIVPTRTKSRSLSPRVCKAETPKAEKHHHTHKHSNRPVEATFLQRMLQYMPLPHRTFLLHLSSNRTPLRQVVMDRKDTHPALVKAYDGALAALGRFRDKHMRIVTRFIVQQARRQPSDRVQKLLGARAETPEEGDDDALRGTGGTPLIRFLKRCRDNTGLAMIEPPAKRVVAKAA